MFTCVLPLWLEYFIETYSIIFISYFIKILGLRSLVSKTFSTPLQTSSICYLCLLAGEKTYIILIIFSLFICNRIAIALSDIVIESTPPALVFFAPLGTSLYPDLQVIAVSPLLRTSANQFPMFRVFLGLSQI